MGWDWDSKLSSSDSLSSPEDIRGENESRNHNCDGGYSGICSNFQTVADGPGQFANPMIADSSKVADFVDTMDMDASTYVGCSSSDFIDVMFDLVMHDNERLSTLAIGLAARQCAQHNENTKIHPKYYRRWF